MEKYEWLTHIWTLDKLWDLAYKKRCYTAPNYMNRLSPKNIRMVIAIGKEYTSELVMSFEGLKWLMGN